MKAIITNPSWYDIEKATAVLCNQILKANIGFDYIIGFGRGGLVPAVLMSHMLSIPMIPITYSSKEGKGDDKNHANVLPPIPENPIDTNRILLVDDIVDSGLTMAEVENHYEKTCRVNTAALYWKTTSVDRPTFHRFAIPGDAPFIVFPWEI